MHIKHCIISATEFPVSIPDVKLHENIAFFPVLFIVVLQELPNCLHIYMVKVSGRYHSTKIRCTTLSSF